MSAVSRFVTWPLVHLYRPCALRVIARERRVRVAGLRLVVPAGVFHPGVFFSSRTMARSLRRAELRGRTVLDVGCGSGVLALVAARRGASATAVDINPVAVETCSDNARRNGLQVEVLHSDLFAALRGRTFDLVVVNPPFFRKDPVDAAEHAWFAGKDLGYFDRFFAGLGAVLGERGAMWMVLSANCDIDSIRSAARSHGHDLREVERRRQVLDTSIILVKESDRTPDVQFVGARPPSHPRILPRRG
jgi:release factor glutamine methyltransferase